MNVRILRRAEADLNRIAEHIEIDNPAAARATIRRIRKRCLDLADFPHQGRPAGVGRRELVIAGPPSCRLPDRRGRGAHPAGAPSGQRRS